MNRHFFQPASVLVLSFLAVISIGTLLLMLPLAHAEGAGASALTALFTATSAVCVTGLVVVDTGTYWSGFGQGVILALFQLGGFGMMTSATLLGLLVNRQLRLRSRLLLQAETHSLGLGDVKSIARLVLIVTVVVELGTALLLTLRFALGHAMPWGEAAWHGLFHAVSAYNNAGFSTWSDSVMGFAGDAWVLGPLMMGIVIGGLGFPVLHELMLERGRRRHRSMHTVLTLWGSAALVLAGSLVIYLAEMNNPRTLGPLGWTDQALRALFSAVSARTAGFNAVDVGQLSPESLMLHYALMFIGGGSAGTAGGVKITTFFVLLLVVWNEVRGHQDVEFRGRRIATAVQRQALTILVLSVAVIVLAMLVLLPMTNLPLDKVLFEVISAFATVGLSTGITAELPPAGQLVLVVLMFTGRVGVVTLAASMAMNHARRDFRYPEEKPIVG
ncbi:TrkH family potassium uptake protein [Polaromonas sp. JS666]|uniref:TrkH family potassium uptake protein n=1 Tax=Polaromonas sp. (strain JS666 / ATCC BAA-500) TaxID=296591 RepID=UPI0000537B39|nr:potassium transporter TrkG [Polaromonas sp. JS666]ABE42180.1 cation transporter [Polaromonas sp. JS666]